MKSRETYFIIIRGPLGIGKTTIAKEVAKRINAKYISIDEILEKRKLDTIDEKIGKIPLKNFLLANKIISKYKEDLVIDGNFYYNEQIEDLIKRLKNCKVFTLKASLDECIKRDKTRINSYGKSATKTVYNLVSSFDYGTIIDTKDKSVEEVVEGILNKIKQDKA